MDPDLVPATLPVVTQLGRNPAAQPWLRGLPALVGEVRDIFGLRLSAPLHGGSCSWVAPARLPDGTEVIVKIGWPHPEMYGEAAALRWWDGRGAVRLLAHDPARHAMVLERCVPGGELRTAPGTPEDRLLTACAVLRRLWQAPPPPACDDIDALGAVTCRWADLAEERMERLRPGFDPALVAEGVALLRALPASAGRRVLLHGDFNPGNVLSAGGGRWVAIDPKPMVGDPAYDPWPMLEQIGDPLSSADPARVLRDRVTLLAGALDEQADRLVSWALARRVEAALWTVEHGDPAGGAEMMAGAGVLARL